MVSRYVSTHALIWLPDKYKHVLGLHAILQKWGVKIPGNKKNKIKNFLQKYIRIRTHEGTESFRVGSALDW